jgi:DNA invertase Pin-like site-specific DNA recombinase
MSKAVAYFRVSTASQGRSGLGLDAQRAAVMDLAAQRRLNLLADYTEVESGKRSDRPELIAALHHAKITGSTLVIAKLDRLSRNAAFLLTLRDSGVRFLAADMPDANDVTIGVMAIIAQAEREATSKRTAEALAAIKTRIKTGVEHISRRSGKVVVRLGNPNGTQGLRRAGNGNIKAVAGAREAADHRAEDLRPFITNLIAEGIVNERGVATANGGRWHVSSTLNLLTRLEGQNIQKHFAAAAHSG